MGRPSTIKCDISVDIITFYDGGSQSDNRKGFEQSSDQLLLMCFLILKIQTSIMTE